MSEWLHPVYYDFGNAAAYTTLMLTAHANLMGMLDVSGVWQRKRRVGISPLLSNV